MKKQFQFPFTSDQFNDHFALILLCVSAKFATYLSKRKIFWIKIIERNETHIYDLYIFYVALAVFKTVFLLYVTNTFLKLHI
jgi:hypothetical protein